MGVLYSFVFVVGALNVAHQLHFIVHNDVTVLGCDEERSIFPFLSVQSSIISSFRLQLPSTVGTPPIRRLFRSRNAGFPKF